MFDMILRMSIVTLLYITLSVVLWVNVRNKKIGNVGRITIGIIYGICSILSTHFGIDFGDYVLNVRDIGPLAAGLFFDPVSGVIAGLIGGIERYIAGTYFGVSSYTCIACSVSTCLAGFLAMIINIKVLKGKLPVPFYAFFMGAVMEVFHMYAVFVTHQDDINMAFKVVRSCSIPMIIFTGIGMAASARLLKILSVGDKLYLKKKDSQDIPISDTIQRALFIGTFGVIVFSFVFNYMLQYQAAYQSSVAILERSSREIVSSYVEVGTRGKKSGDSSGGIIGFTRDINSIHVGNTGFYDIVDEDGSVVSGVHKGQTLPKKDIEYITDILGSKGDTSRLFDESAVIRADQIRKGRYLITAIPTEEAYLNCYIWGYETGLADILLFTVVYVLILFLIHRIVVQKIQDVNESLGRITNGDLNEVVNVRSSLEFTSLSNDINKTVDSLKGYIDAAKKKMEEELTFAYTIQNSALPKNFEFTGHDEFEVFAMMDPAKEVGGDFYDFFFVTGNRLALVIADVSGKGIPAALFMMRAKTAVRSLAETGRSPREIISTANNELCDGNDAGMFVTVWLGILDLKTGLMTCSNAGHEYPVIMHEGGEYEYLRDKHGMPLGAMEDSPANEYEVAVMPGDRIFVYTDGVPEAINNEEKQYGEQRLLNILNTNREKTMKELLPIVRKDVLDFADGAAQFDDITMLGFHLMRYYG